MTAYMVSGAVMTIVIGRLADIYGAKKMLMMMMICYTVGTILAGFAQDISTLIAIRTLQGIAVAVMPIGFKIVRDQFPKGKFSVGQSILTSIYSGGMVVGVILGPSIVQGSGWQSVFYMCAPIAVVLLFISWRFLRVDESSKIHEANNVVDGDDDHNHSRPGDIGKARSTSSKQHIDMKGIITMAVALISFLIAITYSGSITSNSVLFIVPLVVGIISLILFIIVEKRVRSPLVDLKLMFHPVIFAGNMSMLMLGIVQYIVITAIPQIGANPPPSGLGIDAEKVGLLQLPFGLATLILGPVFGVLALRKGFNLKLMTPAMVFVTISFLLLTLFHSTPSQVAGNLVLFGIGAALLPVTLVNTLISFTPREFTGISSAATSTMRIVGGAIGPVITTVILSSSLVPITMDDVTKDFPSPITFTIVFGVAVIMSIASLVLVYRVKHLATKMAATPPPPVGS